MFTTDHLDQHDYNIPIYMNCEGLLPKAAIGGDATSDFDRSYIILWI